MKKSERDIDKAVRNTKASFAAEGLYLTNEEERLIREKIKGELSDEGFLNEVKKLNKIE